MDANSSAGIGKKVPNEERKINRTPNDSYEHIKHKKRHARKSDNSNSSTKHANNDTIFVFTREKSGIYKLVVFLFLVFGNKVPHTHTSKWKRKNNN